MKELTRKLDTPAKQLVAVALLLLLLILATGPNKYVLSIVYVGCIYVILVSGLDILLGYTGMMNTGMTAFYAIGAYTSALLSLNTRLPVLVTMLLGALLSALAGYLLAFGTSRLVKHFLVITTTAFAQVVYALIVNWKSLTNSFSGLRRIPKISLFGYTFSSNLQICILYAVIMLVFLIVKNRLYYSRTGRAFLAIRDNPVAAAGVGINVNRYKRMAFAICAFYGGFAGTMFAHAVSFISPESFSFAMSLTFLTMVLLGGRGSLLGPVIGSLVLCICQAVLQPLGQAQAIVYGGLLLAVVLFFPTGLYGMGAKIVNSLQKGVDARKKEDTEHA